MNYTIFDADGAWKIALDDPSCVAVDLHAPVPAYLTQGVWLILLIAVWSATDRAAIEQAANAIASAETAVTFGVGVFESHDEVKSWNAEVKTTWQSPIWLLVRRGAVWAERSGALDDRELQQMLQSLNLE